MRSDFHVAGQENGRQFPAKAPARHFFDIATDVRKFDGQERNRTPWAKLPSVYLASKSEPNFRLVLPKSQIRQLDFRFWISDFGFWVSDFGFRVSDLWFWTFDFGCWVLDFGFWIGLVSNLDLAAPNGPVWILDLGFATLNHVDSGPRHLWLSTLFFNVNSMGL